MRLVLHINLNPILHSFRDIARFVLMTHPYSTLILGVFPLDHSALVGISPSRKLKLINHEIILKYSNLSENIPERHRRTDGQTDRRTTYCGIKAEIH